MTTNTMVVNCPVKDDKQSNIQILPLILVGRSHQALPVKQIIYNKIELAPSMGGGDGRTDYSVWFVQKGRAFIATLSPLALLF